MHPPCRTEKPNDCELYVGHFTKTWRISADFCHLRAKNVTYEKPSALERLR